MSVSSLIYIANIRFPTEKAHGYQIARVCTELVAQGIDTTLYVPRRRNHIATPWHSFYDLPDTVRVVRVPCLDLTMGNSFFDRIAFFVQLVTFACALSVYSLDRTTPVMTRDKALVWLFGLCGFRIFYNAHSARATATTRRMISRASGVVCNSRGTEEAIKQITTAPTVVIPNGADQNSYRETPIATLRAELSLPHDSTIVLYSGHLYSWKGADTIFETARMIRENTQVLFICVGGLAEDVTRYRNKALEQGLSNIRYLGHQEKSLIPKYLVAADILLLPNTDEHEEVRTQTSPLKLFEYLAAGKPIVASDLPAIRSLVSGEEVFFTPAGRSEDLRNAIEAIIAQSHVREQYAHKAYEASLRYTWAIHVSKLKAFLTHIL